MLSWNDALASLAGFQHLPAVGGDLVLLGNDSLINLDGFDRIRSIADALTIQENANLASLHGLGRLAWVGLAVTIDNNAALPNCEVEWLSKGSLRKALPIRRRVRERRSDRSPGDSK